MSTGHFNSLIVNLKYRSVGYELCFIMVRRIGSRVESIEF